LSNFLCNRSRRCLRTDDRMNFVLRPRLSLPSAWALANRYPGPHPRGRALLLYSKSRQISSQPIPENTHVTSNSFPPLPSALPEPPAYPCPHLTDFDALKPLYRRHWKVCASYNNARETKTVALEKSFTLTKYRHTLEFFNDVMGLQGICAQERVSPSPIARGNETNTTVCSASPNWCPIHVHDVDVHPEDLECRSGPISARYPAFCRDNVKRRTPGCSHRKALRGQVRVFRKRGGIHGRAKHPRPTL
jgi:hypothetical protein